MILRDFAYAVADLGLVLVLTLLLLAVLFFIGFRLWKRALKLHTKADRIASHANNPAAQGEAARVGYAAAFWQGISTELFGAVVTTLAFGVVVLVFQQYQSVQNRKAELILQMGSPDNAFAIEAARQLRVLGWLDDGSLQGTSLIGADLQNASMSGVDLQYVELLYANLQGANLIFANLQGANLGGADLRRAGLLDANLQGANLIRANLQGSDLRDTYLQDADLREANLQEADLSDANLQGANLLYANLRGANIEDASFSESTILPDGLTQWTPNTDITRYTDPNHPDFWQPDWVIEQSP